MLHLGPDSHNYDYVISNLERLGIKNQLFIVDTGNDKKKPEKVNAQNVHGFAPNSVAFKRHVEKLPTLKKVVIHYLTASWAKFILALPNDIEVVWAFWGNDGYLLPKMREGNYSNKTTQSVKKNAPSSKNVIQKLRLVKKWLLNEKSDIEYLEQGLKRIDICATWVRKDWDKIKSSYHINPKHIFFSYYSIDMLLDTSLRMKPTANSILVGHSGDPANNHLDAFDLIIERGWEYDIIICPLTYGFNAQYESTIIETGGRLFGDKFHPLRKHLPKKEYNVLLSNVKIGLALHNYQKGAGNTLSLIWMGAAVYMRESNTLYQTYRSWGLDVFTESGEIESVPDKTKNQTILQTEMSQEKINMGYLQLTE